MPNDQAHDPRVATAGERVAQAVVLSVAAVASGDSNPSDNWPAEFNSTVAVSAGFESADLSPPSVNSLGFTWAGTNRTAVVTMNPGPKIVYQNNQVVNIDGGGGQDWTAKTGDYSLLFSYPANAVGDETWVEQRFGISDPGLQDIWVAFDLRAPTNYSHTDANQKLFYLWMDGYSAAGDGSTCGLEFRPTSPSGSSYMYCKIGAGRFNNSGIDRGSRPFITVSEDRGKWMRFAIRVKAESSAGAGDGSMEVWRKWEDETAFTKEFEFLNESIVIPTSGAVTGFRSGYLMGWANGLYAETTDFLIDNVEIANGGV